MNICSYRMSPSLAAYLYLAWEERQIGEKAEDLKDSNGNSQGFFEKRTI